MKRGPSQETRRFHGVEDVGWSWRDRALLALALLPGATFMLVFVWRAGWDAEGSRQFTLFDDAMISMTYGRTLADTGEWVWYPSGPRVQGFTNPLWTLFMALLHKFGLEGSSAALAVSLTGIVLVLASSVLVAVLVRRVLTGYRFGRLVSAVAAGTTPFLYPLVFWTLRGMEAGLLAFLALLMVVGVTGAMNGLDARQPRAGAMGIAALGAVLGALTRLDFVAPAAVLLAWCLWWAPDRSSRLRVTFIVGVPLAICVSAVLVFQCAYWGDWLPNTYRLKVEGFSPGDRVLRGVVTSGKALSFLTIVALAMLTAIRNGNASARRLVLALGSVILTACLYSVWVGGDAWEASWMANRYIAVFLPAGVVVAFTGVGLFLKAIAAARSRVPLALVVLVPIAGLGYALASNPLAIRARAGFWMAGLLAAVAVLFVLCAKWNPESGEGRARALVIVLLTAVGVVASTSALPGYFWLTTRGLAVDSDGDVTRKGKALARLTQADALIATDWAGAIAYYCSRPMVDLLGKSDRQIANRPPIGDLYPGHNKWDYDYSIGRLRPDVVATFWAHDDSDLQRLKDWGYIERCFGRHRAYFLTGSTRIYWFGLRNCP
jgi:hypothetical protein